LDRPLAPAGKLVSRRSRRVQRLEDEEIGARQRAGTQGEERFHASGQVVRGNARQLAVVVHWPPVPLRDGKAPAPARGVPERAALLLWYFLQGQAGLLDSLGQHP